MRRDNEAPADLLIVCDELPTNRIYGHTVKTLQLVRELSAVYAVACIGYLKVGCSYSDLHVELEKCISVTLVRNRRLSYLDTLLAPKRNRSVLIRDFDEEARIVQKYVDRNPRLRILTDFITGSPLCSRFPGKVFVSGHDCMSALMRHEASCEKNLLKKFTAIATSYRFRFLERDYLQYAKGLHVLADYDKCKYEETISIPICVIPLLLQGPIAEPNEVIDCGRRIVWFNAELATQRQGVEVFLKELCESELEKWTFIGRVDAQRAFVLCPMLKKIATNYISYVDDMSRMLRGTSIVFLPDIVGCGQKNRTLQALSSGCAVIGFEEVFRGINIGKNGHRGAFVIKSGPDIQAAIDTISRDPVSNRLGAIRIAGDFAKSVFFRDDWRRFLDI